jgi:glycosyltransferase involved in cell wall biosynthesis
MSRLRVVLFSSEYPPYVYGGLGTHVHEITSALAARGLKIELVVPQRNGGYQPVPPRVEMHQVQVGEACSNEHFWLQFCENATNIVSRTAKEWGGQINAIHCHDWMTVLAGIRLRELLGIPLIFNIHLPQTVSPNLPMENLGLIWADCILANSRAVAQEIGLRGLPVKSLRVIPNGVNSSYFVPRDCVRADRYVLFVGRLVAQKGVDVALRAFSTLLHRCPDVRLVVVGDGDQALFLQRLARQLGIPSHVSFVGWQRDDALVRFYQGAEVVVVPSLYEPFGIVALEAMACGRPVVASSAGGLAEIIDHGVTGYLTKPGDHLELAQQLAALLLNPTLGARVGISARHRALSLSWGRIAIDTERVYEQLLNEKLAPPLGDVPSLAKRMISDVEPSIRPLATRIVSECQGIIPRIQEFEC